MKYETINDAVHAWVAEFNAIPMAIIDKLLEQNSEELHEITPPSVGDRVFVFDSIADEDTGEIIEHNKDIYTIKLDDGTTCVLEAGDFEVQHDEFLPMWGTMWAFGDSIDNWWLEDGGLQIMADCGFRIYEQEDYDYIFGIDGAGYSFYDEHWIPLYKARGLKWHKEESELQEQGGSKHD